MAEPGTCHKDGHGGLEYIYCRAQRLAHRVASRGIEASSCLVSTIYHEIASQNHLIIDAMSSLQDP